MSVKNVDPAVRVFEEGGCRILPPAHSSRGASFQRLEAGGGEAESSFRCCLDSHSELAWAPSVRTSTPDSLFYAFGTIYTRPDSQLDLVYYR